MEWPSRSLKDEYGDLDPALVERLKDGVSEAEARAQLEMLRYGTPIEYVLGLVERFGREFKIDRRAYIPDAQTEMLVETVLADASPDDSVLEVGTGCGWIAITLKLENPSLIVASVDIERPALELARQNAEAHGLEVTEHPSKEGVALLHGSFVYGLEIPEPRIIVADLPWGDESLIMNPRGRAAQLHMPATAVFHPEGVIGAYIQLLRSVDSRGWKPHIYCEIGAVPLEVVRAEIPEGWDVEIRRIDDGYSVAVFNHS